MDCQSLRIEDANAAALSLYGYSRQECLCSGDQRPLCRTGAYPGNDWQKGDSHPPSPAPEEGRYGVPGRNRGQLFRVSGRAQDPRRRHSRHHRTRAGRGGAAASEERYRVLVETIPQLAWQRVPMAWSVDCNRRWYEYTGQTPAQVRAPRLAGGGASRRPVSRSSEHAHRGQHKGTRANSSTGCGGRRTAATAGILRGRSRCCDEDGQVTCWIGSATDIEELKQAQEILKQAHDEQLQRHQAELAHVARLSMMGEMAASLAHELNQPLHAVKNYACGSICRLRKMPQETRTGGRLGADQRGGQPGGGDHPPGQGVRPETRTAILRGARERSGRRSRPVQQSGTRTTSRQDGPGACRESARGRWRPDPDRTGHHESRSQRPGSHGRNAGRQTGSWASRPCGTATTWSK